MGSEIGEHSFCFRSINSKLHILHMLQFLFAECVVVPFLDLGFGLVHNFGPCYTLCTCVTHFLDTDSVSFRISALVTHCLHVSPFFGPKLIL